MSKLFKPYYDKVYVRPTKTDSFLPQDTGQFQENGIVLAVGSDVKFCSVGDTIYFASWLVHEIEIDEVKNYVIPEEAFLGKIGKIQKKHEVVKKQVQRKSTS